MRMLLPAGRERPRKAGRVQRPLVMTALSGFTGADCVEVGMVRQPGFFDFEERLRELSARGDALERIAALVDFAKVFNYAWAQA